MTKEDFNKSLNVLWTSELKNIEWTIKKSNLIFTILVHSIKDTKKYYLEIHNIKRLDYVNGLNEPAEYNDFTSIQVKSSEVMGQLKVDIELWSGSSLFQIEFSESIIFKNENAGELAILRV